MDDEALQKQRVITYSVDVYITIGLITLFAYVSLQLLMPFVSILAWAAIMAVAIYPVFLKIREMLGGRTGWAATLVALIGLVIILIPAFMVVQSMMDSLGDLARTLRSGTLSVPPPAESLKGIPLIGERLFAVWAKAHTDLSALLGEYSSELGQFAVTALSTGAGLALGVLQFAFSIIFAAVFLSFAGPLVSSTDKLAGRIASRRGRNFVAMAGATIRNVSRGVLGVAVIQGGLAAIGFLVAGLPFAGFIAAACIAACIVQVPVLVIVPSIIYVWSVESTVFALIFTVYMVPVLLSDNFLKPILMARGLETPMVVILIGVIGGTVTAGLMGLFIGPVVLALFYEMVMVWVDEISEGGDSDATETPSISTDAAP